MNTIVISCLLVVFFALMLGIGFACRKHSTNVGGFVLGGRAIGPWLTAFAYGTSYFSAVIFVGYAGQFGWTFGIASTWIGIGNALIGSLLAWVVLGRRTRIMTQSLSAATMPDFFEKRFGSTGLKVAASCITFVFLIPYTASLYNGLSRLFDMAYESIDYAVCVIIMAVLTGIYVLFGGYMATAVNDFIQGIIMIGGIVAVIAAVLKANGGLLTAMETLATSPQGGWKYTSFFGADPVFLLFVILLTSLGTWGLPQMVGKFYSIKDEGAIKKGTIISTAFAFIIAGGCYFLGGFGRLYDVGEAAASGKFDAIIPKMLSTLPGAIIGIVIVLVLSASMSTLSSLVLTSGSTVTLDLIQPICEKRNKSLNEKKKMITIRAFIVVFIVVSAVIAIVQYHSPSLLIAQMMGVSWGALAGAFLAPFLYGLYWKKTSRGGVIASFVFGVTLEIVQLLISLKVFSVSGIPVLSFVFRNSLYSGVFAMVGGLILVPVVSLLTRGSVPKDADRMFDCYHRTMTVEAMDSLGKETGASVADMPASEAAASDKPAEETSAGAPAENN